MESDGGSEEREEFFATDDIPSPDVVTPSQDVQTAAAVVSDSSARGKRKKRRQAKSAKNAIRVSRQMMRTKRSASNLSNSDQSMQQTPIDLQNEIFNSGDLP